MQPDFQEFLKECNKNYKDKYFPAFCTEQAKRQKTLEEQNPNDDDITLLGKMLGVNFGTSIRFCDTLILKYLENYNNWLLKNYNITPKD